jgi:hypothetical protein
MLFPANNLPPGPHYIGLHMPDNVLHLGMQPMPPSYSDQWDIETQLVLPLLPHS